jgi:ribosomal protein L11 methyltransferase
MFRVQLLITLAFLLFTRLYGFHLPGRDRPTMFVRSVSPGDNGDTQTSGNDGTASSLRAMTFANLRKDQEPQLLCNFLMELGACSTSVTDADYGTDAEVPIFDEFDATGTIRTPERVHAWDLCNLSAHFPASTELSWIMELVQDAFPDLPKYEVVQVENKDWVLHVQKGWKPIVLFPFVLRFPWHTDTMVQEALDAAGTSETGVELKLQGGIAFGTGEHPTTQLCMGWIANVLSSSDSVKKVMDYGAGSGVLGIAACKLDPSVTAVGVDIDVDAVHIANANAQENKVKMTNYLSDLVQTTDDESRSVLLKAYNGKQGGGAQVLPPDCNGPIYDAVVANILAVPLVTLAPTLAGLLRPGGRLGLSGIMTSQGEMVINAYNTDFDDVKVERESSGWVLVTGTKKLG